MPQKPDRDRISGLEEQTLRLHQRAEKQLDDIRTEFALEPSPVHFVRWVFNRFGAACASIGDYCARKAAKAEQREREDG
ncbi:hypothetical protein AAFN86_11585 [Roseomonas sp. CAU 1739]|uniref:hypothetical protein n=1 Tax=Roseomonas sp. CAU 1739 TaxID=3140364 RepID=UPI00325B45A0